MNNDEIKEYRYLRSIRRQTEMKPYEPVKRRCLRCDIEFNSWDKRKNYICPECKKKNVFNELYRLFFS